MSVLFVFVVTPLLMGGCAEFQRQIANEIVSAIDAATQTLTSDTVPLFFDQFRSN